MNRYLFLGCIIKKKLIGNIKDKTSSFNEGAMSIKRIERYKIIGMTFSIDK